MSDGVRVTKIEIDELALKRKVEDLIHNEQVMTEVHQQFAKVIDPYVPYDTGYLAHTITVDADCVTYHADYAAKNYYGTDIRHKTDKHPLATAYWDEVAMQSHKDEFAKQVEEIIKRKAK